MPESAIPAMLATLNLSPSSQVASPAGDAGQSPPGCESWCHGQGHRRLAADPLPFDPSRVPSLADTLRTLRYAYCPCEAGQRARQRHAGVIRSVAAREIELAQARVWDAAGVPLKLRAYTVESYLTLDGASPRVVEILRSWQPVAARGRTAILHGAQGTYKTSLAVSLLNEALEDGQSGLFLVCRSWLSKIRASYAPGSTRDAEAATEWRMVSEAAAVPLLVLDDVEMLSEWGQGIVFQLLAERDNWCRPTILTTNLTLDQLEQSLGKRTFDWLRGTSFHPETGQTFVLAFEGESRRGLAAVDAAP